MHHWKEDDISDDNDNDKDTHKDKYKMVGMEGCDSSKCSLGIICVLFQNIF